MTPERRNLIITGLLLLIFGAAYFTLESVLPVQKGLHSHLRRGNDLIERGRYRKAFREFARVYEARPGDAALLRETFHGYIRYARHLESKGALAEAMTVLRTVHEDFPDEYAVAQEYYRLKLRDAIELAKAGRTRAAAVVMSGATERIRSYGSGKLRLSLSNYLLSAGATAFTASEGDLALLALESSYNLWANFEALYLLGRYHYQSGDIERAGFWWSRALEIRPDDKHLPDLLARLREQAALERDMPDLRTGRFDLKLYEDYGLDVSLLKAVLEQVSAEVEAAMGIYPQERSRIVIYSETDFRELFGGDGIIRAFYDGAIRMHLTGTFQESGLKAIVAHEYTHALISMVTGPNCPVWLHEGLAVLQQARYEEIPVTLFEERLRRGHEFTVEGIERSFLRQDDLEQLALSYQASYSLVGFMMERWGAGKIRNLLQRIGEGRHYANAVDEVYYVTLSMLENMWMEAVLQEMPSGL